MTHVTKGRRMSNIDKMKYRRLIFFKSLESHEQDGVVSWYDRNYFFSTHTHIQTPQCKFIPYMRIYIYIYIQLSIQIEQFEVYGQ